MLNEKLQDAFMSIGKSYETEDIQIGIILLEIQCIKNLVREYGELKIIEEIDSWKGHDSFEWYWLYLSGIKPALSKLEPYLESSDLSRQAYAAIAMYHEGSEIASVKLDALRLNYKENIDEFGFNGVNDELKLFNILISQVG